MKPSLRYLRFATRALGRALQSSSWLGSGPIQPHRTKQGTLFESSTFNIRAQASSSLLAYLPMVSKARTWVHMREHLRYVKYDRRTLNPNWTAAVLARAFRRFVLLAAFALTAPPTLSASRFAFDGRHSRSNSNFVSPTAIRTGSQTVAAQTAPAQTPGGQGGARPPGTQPGTGGTGTGSSTGPDTTAANATQASAWSVDGPGGDRWVLLWGPAVEIAVSAGDQPLSNVRLVRSTLQNAETGARIDVGALELCRASTDVANPGRCISPGTIKAQESAALALRLKEGSVPPGVYTGFVSFEANGGTGRKPLNLRVEQSSYWKWGFGIAAIFLGILLAWLVTVYLRQQSIRNTALLPAAQIGETVRKLCEQVENAVGLTKVDLPRLKQELSAREKALSPQTLEVRHFIPRRLPNFFAIPADVSNAYSQYLAEQSARVAALAVIVRRGIVDAVTEWSKEPLNKDPILRALTRLDEAAPAAADPTITGSVVESILEEMRKAFPNLAAEAKERTGRIPSTRELQVQIQRVSLAAWGVWMILTVLVGAVALVITNYGFGTPMDYIKCLLWGLGVPIAGQQLQQLTPNAISTAFNLTLPK